MQNINFEFTPQTSSNHHECEATRVGDWIVYRCPKCSDYQRWYNWRTGKMKTKGLKANIRHGGFCDMRGYREAPENIN